MTFAGVGWRRDAPSHTDARRMKRYCHPMFGLAARLVSDTAPGVVQWAGFPALTTKGPLLQRSIAESFDPAMDC